MNIIDVFHFIHVQFQIFNNILFQDLLKTDILKDILIVWEIII